MVDNISTIYRYLVLFISKLLPDCTTSISWRRGLRPEYLRITPATCSVSPGCAPGVPCTSELYAQVIASSVVPASLRTLQASALLCRSPLPRAAHRRVEPVRQIASKRGYAHALRYPGPFQCLRLRRIAPRCDGKLRSRDGRGSHSALRTRRLDGSIWRHRCSRAALAGNAF